MNKLFLLSATALVAVWSFNAKAASDSATGTATVEVVQNVEITHENTDKLNFGSVYAKNGNTVTISTAGAKTAGDGFGTVSADKFTISGPNGASVTLTVPADATMNKAGGGSITATLNPSRTGAIALDGNDVEIDVGGSITVSSSTAIGTYTGNYDVTITY